MISAFRLGLELWRVVWLSLLYWANGGFCLNSFRDNWAKTSSPNKKIKIYLGAPASSTATATGYLDVPSLANAILQTRAQYSSFGGVMLWDASQAYGGSFSSDGLWKLTRLQRTIVMTPPSSRYWPLLTHARAITILIAKKAGPHLPP